jgi:hypothetical protein
MEHRYTTGVCGLLCSEQNRSKLYASTDAEARGLSSFPSKTEQIERDHGTPPHHCGEWIIMRCTKQIEAAGAGGYPLSEVKQNGSKGSS